ncbi:MAG: hypothetical protein PHV55_01940 [Candidatus Omnitrophica bacterium]|nr:hypothetical protein [Candidatus Omnitrophota bacterium]
MRKIIIIFLTLSILCSDTAFAGITIYLKNGRQIRGVLVNMDGAKITLDMGRGKTSMKTSIAKDEIKTIEGLSFEEFRRAKNTYETTKFKGEKAGFQSSFNDAMKLVEEKRTLSFIVPVQNEVIKREAIKEHLLKTLDDVSNDQDLEKEKKLLVKLGLLTQGADYKKMITDVFTRNVAGFYDPKENKMYVVEEAASVISPVLPSEVVMHELVHALQDQYLFLEHFEENLKNIPTDQALAQKAIIEGEATFVSYSIVADYIKKLGSTRMSEEKLASLDIERFILASMLLASESFSADFKNRALIQYLLFPYVRGGMFVKYAYDNGKWESVDKIYKNYPRSTEQIIHPEKYFLVKDEPIPLKEKKLDFFTQNGFVKVDEGVLGEFVIYTIAVSFLDDVYAKMVSTGWGNDHYYLYEKDTKLVLILDTIWDSPLDTEEFFKGAKVLMDKKYPALLWQAGTDSYTGENENNLIYIGKKDTEVLLVESEVKDKSMLISVMGAFLFPSAQDVATQNPAAARVS